jgi:hypothetical protein
VDLDIRLAFAGFGAERAAGILEGGSTWRFGTYKRGWRPIAGTAATAANYARRQAVDGWHKVFNFFHRHLGAPRT